MVSARTQRAQGKQQKTKSDSRDTWQKTQSDFRTAQELLVIKQ